jgi:hypothetical protein
MNKWFLSIAIFAAGFFNGCITPWARSTGSVLNNQSDYALAVTTPAQWYQRQVHNVTLFTRNGLSLESIIINRWKWNDTLSNGYVIPPNVLLHQLPEIILGENCAASQAFNLTITDNQIITVDSFPAAKTTYRYTAPNSLNMTGILYCIPFVKYATIICYEAEASHYYEKSVEAFNTMSNSIVIKKRKYRYLPGIPTAYK